MRWKPLGLAGGVLVAVLLACCAAAVSALPRQLGGSGGGRVDQWATASPLLVESWEKLTQKQQNKATHVYTTAHAILAMGGTPGKKDLVVHSLGAAMEREGTYSGDPNAMPVETYGELCQLVRSRKLFVRVFQYKMVTKTGSGLTWEKSKKLHRFLAAAGLRYHHCRPHRAAHARDPARQGGQGHAAGGG